MKSCNRFISVVIFLGWFFSQSLFAQSVITVASDGQKMDCSNDIQHKMESSSVENTITEADFPYLKNLDCITSGYISDKRNLDLQLRNVNHILNTHYVLTSNGSAIDVEAEYDLEGNLIEATLIEKNTQIPIPILRHIYSDEEFDSWVMVRNEKIVTDFDPNQTEYRVVLTNGDEEEILFFKEQRESLVSMDVE